MLNRIIVSTDDSHFKDYWKIVVTAWKKYYPGVKISLAFVTNRSENDDLVTKMRELGDVVLFPVIPHIPTPNLAKMSRHILAGFYDTEICMVEDIDTIPLQRKYVLNYRQKDELLVIGSEVYDGTRDAGKFPISNMTAESYIFKKIINPNNLNINDLFNSWCGTKVNDYKEDISIHPTVFSDESLMRVIINNYSPNRNGIREIERQVEIFNDWIDRSWWKIDQDKLKNDGYVTCNFLRPFSDNYQKIEPIVRYIFDNDYINKNEVIL